MKRFVLSSLLAAALISTAAAEPKDPHAGHNHPPGQHGAHEHEQEQAERTKPWPKEVISLAESLAIQERGRVKPLKTFAGFQLLKMNGKRKVKTPQGETLQPTAWLLDCWFFPAQAKTYEMFRVQDGDALTRIGLQAKKKRDYYSYDQLEPGLSQLSELAQAYRRKDSKELEPIEREILGLFTNVVEFSRLIRFLDFARQRHPLHGSTGLTKVYPAEPRPGVSQALHGMPGLRVLVTGLGENKSIPEERKQEEVDAAMRLLATLQQTTAVAAETALFPPNQSTSETKEWLSPFEVVRNRIGAAFGTQILRMTDRFPVTPDPMDKQLTALTHLEAMEHNKTSPEVFLRELKGLHGTLKGLAETRNEYAKIPLEVHYYKADWFYRSLLVYLLGFLCLAIGWLIPKPPEGAEEGAAAKWLYRIVLGSLVLATVLCTVGIVERCIIRSRPPVSTLYETILFITSTGVITALAIEWINRQRVAVVVATVIGVLGMFLAGKYEFKEAVTAGDTMTSLVAVLDTNFWLATHVTTVTLGYAAGLLASGIAHVWLIGQLMGYRAGDRSFYRSLSRMVYGVICFGLLFSVIGTILGGIWANYSWGRFWGWDPKENGALMIVLWELAIVHARLGGYIRDLGLAISAVLGGMVVAFSWWGVNLLGTGLHSYGFTDGVATALNLFYYAEAALALIAGLAIWARMSGAKGATA